MAAIARTYFRYQDALETSGLKPTTHASRVTTSTICRAVNVVFSAEFIEDFKTVNLLLQFAIKQISQMQPAPDSANPLALLTPRCNQSGVLADCVGAFVSDKEFGGSLYQVIVILVVGTGKSRISYYQVNT